MNYELIVDSREDKVSPHLLGHAFVTRKIITHGDYAIYVKGRLVASIERKTLPDYGASIRDGRTANKANMFELRKKTGCQLYYIIEHSSRPALGAEFSGVRYSSILNSIFHLRTEHYIFIENTRDPRDTAQFLLNLLSSFIRREPYSFTVAYDFDAPDAQPESTDRIDNMEKTSELVRSTSGSEEELITATIKKTIREQKLHIWKSLRGIGVETAAILSIHPIVNVLCKQEIPGIKKSINEIIDKLLETERNEEQVRFLAAFPGVSTAKARYLFIRVGNLSGFLGGVQMIPNYSKYFKGQGEQSFGKIRNLLISV